MKKKWISFLLLLCLIPTLVLSVAALEDDGLYFVTDAAQLLTESQGQTLEAEADRISREYHCGIYIVLVEDYTEYGSSPRKAAVNLYEDYALGYGADQDGLILLLSMVERDYYLYSHGSWGSYVFANSDLDRLEDDFLDDFGDDQWYDGLSDYLDTCEDFLRAAETDASAGKTDGDDDVALKILGCIGGGCIVALIVCLILKGQLRSVRKKTDASGYMSSLTPQLRIREDRFTHTTQIRRKIETSKSSGGSRSGSGSAGRGGKF